MLTRVIACPRAATLIERVNRARVGCVAVTVWPYYNACMSKFLVLCRVSGIIRPPHVGNWSETRASFPVATDGHIRCYSCGREVEFSFANCLPSAPGSVVLFSSISKHYVKRVGVNYVRDRWH